MGYTARERMMNITASRLGYKTSLHEQGVPITEFKAGDGTIVITKKGEPIVSGKISEIRYPGEEYLDSPGSVKVGDRWYSCNDYYLRLI